MLIYFIVFKPFNDKLFNAIQVYNEALLFLSYVLMLIINMVRLNSNVVEIVGIIIFMFVFISLFLTWIILIPGMIRDVLQMLVKKKPEKKKCVKRNASTVRAKAPNKEDKNQSAVVQRQTF